MYNRRMVTRAGRTLNDAADYLRKIGVSKSNEVESAVRILNEVAYQYYLIPRNIREEFFREDLSNGVQLHDVAER